LQDRILPDLKEKKSSSCIWNRSGISPAVKNSSIVSENHSTPVKNRSRLSTVNNDFTPENYRPPLLLNSPLNRSSSQNCHSASPAGERRFSPTKQEKYILSSSSPRISPLSPHPGSTPLSSLPLSARMSGSPYRRLTFHSTGEEQIS